MKSKLFKFYLNQKVRILTGEFEGKIARIKDRWHMGYKDNRYAISISYFGDPIDIGYIPEDELSPI